MRRIMRTLVLAVLCLAYAAIILRVPAGTGGSPFDPLDPRPHRVESLIVEQHFGDALPLALELRRNFPNEPEPAYWLATTQRGLGHADLESEAWEDYARLSADPLDACPAWPAALERAGRPERAVAVYERCVTLDPRDPLLLRDLADAYARAGRRDAAADAYRRAAALDPDDPAIPRRSAALSGAVR